MMKFYSRPNLPGCTLEFVQSKSILCSPQGCFQTNQTLRDDMKHTFCPQQGTCTDNFLLGRKSMHRLGMPMLWFHWCYSYKANSEESCSGLCCIGHIWHLQSLPDICRLQCLCRIAPKLSLLGGIGSTTMHNYRLP